MNLYVQKYPGVCIFTICSRPILHSQYSCVVSVAQVEEAVAVLQAHQAKKDATQKVGNMATTSASATSWRWCIGMKIHKMSGYSYLIFWSYVIVVILIKWLWCFRSQKTEQRSGEIRPSLQLPVFSEQLCKKCEKKRKSLILKIYLNTLKRIADHNFLVL